MNTSVYKHFSCLEQWNPRYSSYEPRFLNVDVGWPVFCVISGFHVRLISTSQLREPRYLFDNDQLRVMSVILLLAHLSPSDTPTKVDRIVRRVRLHPAL